MVLYGTISMEPSQNYETRNLTVLNLKFRVSCLGHLLFLKFRNLKTLRHDALFPPLFYP